MVEEWTRAAVMGGTRLQGGLHTCETSQRGVPREQKRRKGHLPTVIHHQVYQYMKTMWSMRPRLSISSCFIQWIAAETVHQIQGYLTYKKHPPPGTLHQDYD